MRDILLSAARFVRSVIPGSVRDFLLRVATFVAADPTSLPSVSGSLHQLRSHGFEPQLVIDIGAYEGEWTQMLLSIFPKSRVLMIEPQSSKKPLLEKLSGPNVRATDALLGATSGDLVQFHEMETGSSILPERSDIRRVTSDRTLTTLDGILKVEPPGWNRPDLIKLDVQGYELEVLKGSKQATADCEVVILEASIVDYNEGAPEIDQVIDFMRDIGFRLVDICDQARHPNGTLLQVDLLFIRRDSRLVPDNPR